MKHFIATLIQGSLDYIWKGLYICLTARPAWSSLELGIGVLTKPINVLVTTAFSLGSRSYSKLFYLIGTCKLEVLFTIE